MARDVQRAFLTTLEMTQTPQVTRGNWEEMAAEISDPDFVPAFFPPTPCPLDQVEKSLDEVTAYASLVAALRDARATGFYSENIRPLASRLESTGICDLPSMEDFCIFPDNATSVSLESLRNSIKETFKAILQALAKFWAMLMDMVQGWLESSKLLRTRILLAQGNLREVAGRLAKQDMVSGNIIPWLSTDKVKADNARAILTNLSTLGKQVALLRLNYIPMVVNVTQKFITQFESWESQRNADGVDATQWLEGLNLIAEEYRPAHALGATQPYADRGSSNWRTDAVMTDGLPGHRWIVVIPGPHTDSSDVALAKARALQSTRVLVEDVYARSRDVPKDMRTFKQDEIEKILEQTLLVAKEIEILTHSDTRRSLREMTLRLDRMANSNLDVPDGAVSLFQAGVAYARTISRWAKDPYQGVVLHALNACNNSVRMCNLHMRAYKQAPLPKENIQ
jgi:hypothetical protein